MLVAVVIGIGTFGCSAESESSRVAVPTALRSLERARVLRTLGIPEWRDVRLDKILDIGFEDADELGESYVTPQSETTRHTRWRDIVHSGEWSHTGWLTGTAPTTPEVDGPNHRGYPTVQLSRMGLDACATPCVIDLWVWLDVALEPGQWFSLATFALEPSDRWARVVTVNVGDEGLHLFHVPDQGEGDWSFQAEREFPLRQWVRVTTYLDLDPAGGVAAVWQDGRLASAARVVGGDGTLAQAHFGLYAPPALLHGRVVNDDIRWWRVQPRASAARPLGGRENEAASLVG
jgi:hypothetical protein